MTPLPSGSVPAVVVAMDDKSSAPDDEDSLSDSSSYRDTEHVSRRFAPTTRRGHCRSPRQLPSLYRRRSPGTLTNLPLALPPAGKPLCPKPRLVKSDFLKTRKAPSRTAAVPIKAAVTKARMIKRSSLSHDEKLFVEAAATLVQAQLCK